MRAGEFLHSGRAGRPPGAPLRNIYLCRGGPRGRPAATNADRVMRHVGAHQDRPYKERCNVEAPLVGALPDRS